MTFHNDVDVLNILGTLDFIVLGLFLAGVVFSIFIYHSTFYKRFSFLEYMLMGRALTLPLFVMTLVSTWYGSVLGVTQISYENGIYTFFTQGLFWYSSYLAFAFLVVPKIHKHSFTTLPELVGHTFGKKAHKLAAVFNIFNMLPIAYSITLGILTQSLFGGTLEMNILISTLIIASFTAYGGFRTVVYTDVYQFFFMVFAVFFVLLFSISHFGGYSFLRSHLPDHYFTLTGNSNLLETFSWGIIALETLIDPNFYQRTWAARTEKTAQIGILISTLIWMIFDLCTTFGGMYAKALMPNANSENAYFYYALQLLPDGFRGFFIAGLIAAVVTTLDGYLFIAGTSISADLISKKFRDKRMIHTISVLGTGVISIVLAVYTGATVKEIWKFIGSFFAGSLVVPLLSVLLFKWRISERGFILMTSASVLTMGLCFGLKLSENIVYFGLFASFSMFVISLLSKKLFNINVLN